MHEPLARLALAASLASLATLSPALATDRQGLDKECEVAIALSALPKRLRADATVYALVDGEYGIAVEGDGPFTCVVERNDKDALIPQCMDAAGVDSLLPAILDRSRMSLDGVPFEELRAASHRKVTAGEFTQGIAARSGESRPTFLEQPQPITNTDPAIQQRQIHIGQDLVLGQNQLQLALLQPGLVPSQLGAEIQHLGNRFVPIKLDPSNRRFLDRSDEPCVGSRQPEQFA